MGSRRDTKGTKGAKDTKALGVAKVVAITFVTFASFVSFPSPFPRAQTSDWPQFRGNPALTGVASSDVAQTLSLKWTYEAGETVESSAAIADGAVFVGAGNGTHLAIDVDTGNLRWT
jgi:hypothetical protein